MGHRNQIAPPGGNDMDGWTEGGSGVGGRGNAPSRIPCAGGGRGSAAAGRALVASVGWLGRVGVRRASGRPRFAGRSVGGEREGAANAEREGAGLHSWWRVLMKPATARSVR